MKIVVDIPDYDGNGIDVIWSDDSKFKIELGNNEVIISANQAGLISVAKQLLYMAYSDLNEGAHVHFDSFFTKMNPDDIELVIERKNDL